ncbi:DNA phosphorothioation-associated putative methyltransferase [Oscillatoria sp. FACHB-1406]|uniref:DNA phosphorothioation-associated putative methyltransferase n=1 Tax=Oscillatoria sp. FACHB-1406 TaxID=2692846 RepID=UPI0016869457|nr:DNA phosphorothioation-associated putative methyltransferase [Oscillatoria sp. FACHB-1406]MBD2576150.1 DNA phosphorothioation-associated putative methyltransferase [Oscillatoria sp. FACHB-1406]
MEFFESERFSEIVSRCKHSAIGKHLASALYVHVSALPAIDLCLQDYEKLARSATEGVPSATLVKFNLEKPTLSYLFYPDFDRDPHPALHASIQVNLLTLTATRRDYSTVSNSPILHRKETFVLPDYPHYAQFAELTRQEEALGLLANARFIGTRRQWLQRLAFHEVEIIDHQVIQNSKSTDRNEQDIEVIQNLIVEIQSDLEDRREIQNEGIIEEKVEPSVTLIVPPVEIARHRAAIARKQLSRPTRVVLEAGLFEEGTTFFDYGCGYGWDCDRIAEQGYTSSGWDPYYRPNVPKVAADIVNLSYIINVIEDPSERREALINAWELTQKVLVVAAQVLIQDSFSGQIAYGDGIITRRNTFQKYYEQEELKFYIDRVLEVDAIPVELGIYFVFRDATQAEAFRASRFRSRATTPRIRKQVRRFEDYEVMLAPLMAFVTERGRLPVKGELIQEAEIWREFGSHRRAFDLVLQATEESEWSAIAEKRRQDLKVYLALSHFGKRPKASELSPPVKEDFKALFGSYKQACLLADLMLFSLGDLQNITDICRTSPVGKKLTKSFTVHFSALETLDPLLRLYEGCASRTFGRLESVTLVRFHLDRPQISYLFYPDFDRDPHPALTTSMHVALQDLQVFYQEYDEDNPPLLHEKDLFVLPDYPNAEKFAKLTQQEKDWGLLDDYRAIRSRRGWLKCLEDHSAILKNHQLTRCKDADPYKLKLLRAAVRTRQKKRSQT